MTWDCGEYGIKNGTAMSQRLKRLDFELKTRKCGGVNDVKLR